MSFPRPHAVPCSGVCAAILLAWLAWLAMALPALSEAASVPPVDAAIADLEAARSAAEKDAALGEEARGRVLDLLARAMDERRKAIAITAETKDLSDRVAAAPKRVAELEARVHKGAETPASPNVAGMSLDKLSTRATETQQALESARDALKARERDLAALTALGPGLSEQIAASKQELRRLKDDAGSPPAEALPAAVEAAKSYRDARDARLSAEIAKWELTLRNYELLVRLDTLERDAAALEVSRLDAQRGTLVAALEAKRAEQARTARQEAQVTQEQTAGLPAAVAALAAENANLRQELEKVTLDTGKVAEQLRAAERRASELESDLVSIRERVSTVGPTEAIGRLLRRRLQALHGIETDRLRSFVRAGEIVRVTDRRIDLGEQRRDLALTQARVDEVLASVPEAERASMDDAALRKQTADLVSAKRTTIDELHEAYGRYLTQLTAYDAAERQITATAETMRQFIRRQILWTRTLPVISLSDFAVTGTILARLLAPGNWMRVLTDASEAAAEAPALSGLGLLVALTLLAARPWARRRLAEVGALTSRIRTDAFRHTLSALVLTLIIASTWPVIAALSGWLVGAAQDSDEFSREIGVTLLRVSTLLMIFTTVRWLIHYNGLARLHFRWAEPVRVMLRREFRWFTPLAVTCVVLGVYGSAQGTEDARIALGRPALMIFAAALATLFWRLFRRASPLTDVMLRRHASGLAARTRALWFPALVAVPAVNVLAATVGYNEAARTATLLLIDTGWLVIGVWVLRDVMLRWFTVSERRLRFEQALKQREESRAERMKQHRAGEEPPPTEAAEVDVPEVDYRELGEQGRSVVQAAVLVGVVFSLWTLWSNLLPAINVLDRLQLPMTRVALVDGVEQQVAVTGTDLLLALLVVAATLFAAKNLSGLLGFTVLRRISGDAGARYAIVTLCQYVLVAVGLLYAFATIGVQWSKLQWLVAALGVGLGFGLQEIVANFVSGIILLLERPIRVGDTVTVGDATGTVTRIRIRATTIVDWDRKELVVPNKEFVTGRLLNWTLSNDTLRLVIPVGVAYGSDVRRARSLLLEAASENKDVLRDPAPLVLFNSFGDNALGLELRVYLPSIGYLLPVQTDLHDAIYEKFERSGIVISFPQRDVHLDTSAPLDIRIHDATPAPRAPRRPWRRDA